MRLAEVASCQLIARREVVTCLDCFCDANNWEINKNKAAI